MDWTHINNWEQLSKVKEGFHLEHPFKCNVVVMAANTSVEDGKVTANELEIAAEWKAIISYSARIYIIPKRPLPDNEADIYDITLTTSQHANNFKLIVSHHLGLDSQGNSKLKPLFTDTYPKSVYSARLTSPQKFIEFVITEIYDKNKN